MAASRKRTRARGKTASRSRRRQPPRIKSLPREAPLIRELKSDHRQIASVLSLFSEQLDAIESGDLVDPTVIYEVMDYMVSWPDRFHHPREDLLFAHVADLDAGAAPECRELQHEHADMASRGQALLAVVREWRRGTAPGNDVIRLGRDYIAHYHQHMTREERELFPLIELTLSDSDWRDLGADEAMQTLPDPVFGRRVQREFRTMARKLRRSVRRGVEDSVMLEWVGIDSALEGLEVIGMAMQNGRAISRERLRCAAQEALYMTLEKPLQAPVRCSVNNARHLFGWAEEVTGVYRDLFGDLVRVNRERRDRVRLVRQSRR
jgi:hemerythrin-like domain-containing protein